MSLQRIAELLEVNSGISKVHRKTAAVAIAETIAPGQRWVLKEIRLHLNAVGGAGNLTVNVDHGTNAAYDFNLLTQDMTSEKDVIWQPDRPLEFTANDEVDIAWDNAGNKTYGLEVLYSLI